MIFFIVLGIIAVVWVLCALYTYPTNLAYFQRKWWNVRAKNDRNLSFFLSLTGPIGAVITFFGNDKGIYGRTWKATDSEWVLSEKQRDLDKIEQYRDEWDG